MLQITAAIKEIRPTETINTRSGNPFTKRTIVLDNSRTANDGRQFESYVPIEYTQDRCSLLDTFAPGEIVTVTFDINGRYYQPSDRYYIELRGFSIRPAAAAATPQAPAPIPQAPPAPQPTAAIFPEAPAGSVTEGNSNDLPF